jgi:hypothetical protein
LLKTDLARTIDGVWGRAPVLRGALHEVRRSWMRVVQPVEDVKPCWRHFGSMGLGDRLRACVSLACRSHLAAGLGFGMSDHCSQRV